MCVYVGARGCVCASVCVCVCACLCLHVCVCVFVRACVGACERVCMLSRDNLYPGPFESLVALLLLHIKREPTTCLCYPVHNDLVK